jgi:hypothetical protein
MPAEIIGIHSYTYYQFSSREGSFKAVAICAGSGSATVYLYFNGGTAALPPASKTGSNYFVYYRHEDMPAIIDMLRNEAPVSLIYVPEGTNNTRLSTSSEPVGEGELT